MSLEVPGRAGACTDMAERQPNHIPEPQRAPHEGGNGSPGLPPTVHERANPPPESRAYPTLPQKSALNRAVERTRAIYDRNGWSFLPWDEAGRSSPSSASAQGGAESTGVQQPRQPEHIQPLGEEFYQQLRERIRRFPQELVRKENEDFIEKLRRINPEGRERKEKELLEFLFRRLPQDPEQDK